MTGSSPDPLRDEINLVRLVRRLEKTVSGQQTLTASPKDVTPQEWIKVQGTLQKVKFARGLITRVEMYGEEEVVSKMAVMRMKLDEMEATLGGVQEPQPTRPAPILPTIPQSPPPPSLMLDLPSPPSQQQHPEEIATETQADDLLLPADTHTPALPSSISFAYPTPMTLIPSTLSPSSTTTATSTAMATATGAVPRFLQNSTALQQELSDQLAAMATQLRRNAIHFSETLVRDQSVVDETMVKLEGNLGVMEKERKRLRDHRGKSGGTTCLVVMIVVVVLLLFVGMVGVIRFTRF